MCLQLVGVSSLRVRFSNSRRSSSFLKIWSKVGCLEAGLRDLLALLVGVALNFEGVLLVWTAVLARQMAAACKISARASSLRVATGSDIVSLFVDWISETQ